MNLTFVYIIVIKYKYLFYFKKGKNQPTSFKITKEELKKKLTPVQYQVTQESGTERPFTGCYNDHNEKGTYHCIVCEISLFSSSSKYDSSCGWPAFNDVLKDKVSLHVDISFPEMIRTEVRCANCGAHMGHVFEGEPSSVTGKRFCINSASMTFVKK